MSQPYRGIAHRDLLHGVRDYLAVRGCYYLSIAAGMGIRAGSPDLLCCCAGRMVAVEGKTGTGVLSEAQKKEKARLEAAGALYVLARSIDDVEAALLEAGLIEAPALMNFRGG